MFKATRGIRRHQTDDEIMYIMNIGRFSNQTINIPRKKMLANYIEAQTKKFDWGTVDNIKVMALVQAELWLCK